MDKDKEGKAVSNQLNQQITFIKYYCGNMSDVFT